jgi:hypothetical protein
MKLANPLPDTPAHTQPEYISLMAEAKALREQWAVEHARDPLKHADKFYLHMDLVIKVNRAIGGNYLDELTSLAYIVRKLKVPSVLYLPKETAERIISNPAGFLKAAHHFCGMRKEEQKELL